MPHGHCFLWRKDILYIRVVSDLVIALAYYTIPFSLIYIVRKRKDLEFGWIFALFAAFIFACGTTHLFGVWTLWNPSYFEEGLLKAFTALISIGTALALRPLIPKILAIPSSGELQRTNERFFQEIKERIEVEKFLRNAHQKLEQRDAEKAVLLEERAQRLHVVLEAIVDGIISIDDKSRVMSFNRACEKIFGYSAAEVMGQNINMLIPSPFPERPDGYVKAFLETGKAEVEGRRKDGSVFPVELSFSEVKIGGKRTFTWVIRDITERKRVEMDLIEARETALRASQAKSNFLANMSHEIRTPMNSILGMMDLLEETQMNPEQLRYTAHLRHAGNILLNLINDILDLSKIESGQLTLEELFFDLQTSVENSAEMLSGTARDRGLELVVRIQKGVARYCVGDKYRIEQILVNLIGNAVKFTEKGGITVGLGIDTDPVRSQNVLITVADTGAGIPEDKRDLIFGSFTQGDSSTTRKYGGTGLGLSIVKQLVGLMKGHIWVESELGRGSTFFVSLPLKVVTKKKEERVVAAAVSEEVEEFLSPLKILLVDDSEDNRNLIKLYLKKTPLEIEEANNGEVALEKFKAGSFDLVLMDLQMPVMDGYIATEAIRAWETENGLRPTPILALTAYAMGEETAKSLRVGCNHHLAKPIKKQVLLKAIHSYGVTQNGVLKPA